MKEVKQEEVPEVSGGIRTVVEPLGGKYLPEPIIPDYPQMPGFPDITDVTVGNTK